VSETEWHDTAAPTVPLNHPLMTEIKITDGMVAGRNKYELRHFLNQKSPFELH